MWSPREATGLVGETHRRDRRNRRVFQDEEDRMMLGLEVSECTPGQEGRRMQGPFDPGTQISAKGVR